MKVCMKRMRGLVASGAIALLAVVSARANSVTFTEPAEPGSGSVTETDSGFTGSLYFVSSMESGSFVRSGQAGLTGAQAFGYILFWADAAHTQLSDWIYLEITPFNAYPSTWSAELVSAGDTLAPPSGPIVANITETPGIMYYTWTPTVGGVGVSFTVGLQSDPPVPDGGPTAMLLGMGVVGVGWLRRLVK